MAAPFRALSMSCCLGFLPELQGGRQGEMESGSSHRSDKNWTRSTWTFSSQQASQATQPTFGAVTGSGEARGVPKCTIKMQKESQPVLLLLVVCNTSEGLPAAREPLERHKLILDLNCWREASASLLLSNRTSAPKGTDALQKGLDAFTAPQPFHLKQRTKGQKHPVAGQS